MKQIWSHTGRPDPLSARVTCSDCGQLIELHQFVYPRLAPGERARWRAMLNDILEHGDHAPVTIIVETGSGARRSVAPIIEQDPQ